jgi:hypothetical protein
MSQKKKKREEKFEFKRDEEMKTVGEGNVMPEGIQIDPWNAGLAGKRILIDQLLSLTGFRKDYLDSINISPKDLGNNRKAMAKIADSIIRFDGVRPMRQQARSAMMRLVGMLRLKETAPLLLSVLNAAHEDNHSRTAAADGLGMMRIKKFEGDLLPHLDDDNETIALSVARALYCIGSQKALPALMRRRALAKGEPLQQAIHEAIMRIERDTYGKTKLDKWTRKAKTKQKATIERKFFINEEGSLVEE